MDALLQRIESKDDALLDRFGKDVPEAAFPSAKDASDPTDSILQRIERMLSRKMETTAGDPTPAPSPEPPMPAIHSQCAALAVEFNLNKIFLENSVTALDFRLAPREAGIEGLCIVVEYLGQGGHREACEVDAICFDPGGDPLIETLTLKSPKGLTQPAEIAVRVFVGVRRGGGEHWFRDHQGIKFQYFPDRVSQQEKSQYVINMVAKTEQGHAGDAKIYQNPDLKGLAEMTKHPVTMEEFHRRVSVLPERWQLLALKPCKSQPWPKAARIVCPELASPPASARLDRVTLVCGDRRVHLLGARSIQLGRARTVELGNGTVVPSGNDLVVRWFNQPDRPDKERSRMVSQCHARLALEGDACRLYDSGRVPGASQPQSCKNGVFLDGQRIMPGSMKSLPINRACLLGLGGADPHREACGFRAKLQSCVWGRCDDCPPPEGDCPPDHPACLFLERLDVLPEAFVVVWRHADLGALGGPWSGLKVWRRKDAFAFEWNGQRGWIVPGSLLPPHAGGTVTAEPYRQLGLS